MDLTYTPEQSSFRDALRAWLTTNVPRDLASPGSRGRSFSLAQLRGLELGIFGATLVQLYTAFIYGGPRLPQRLLVRSR